MKHSLRHLLPCLLLLLLAVAAAALPARAAVYPLESVPNVHLSDSTLFVSDPDDYIPAADEARINSLLRSLMAGTTAEVAVAVVGDIPADVEPDDFATDLFRRWGIGKSDNDNGLLLLAVMDRHKVVIRTGYGLEGLLPDGVCGSIIRSHITPAFRQCDYGRGLYDAADAISTIITDPVAAAEVKSAMANNAAASDRGGGSPLFSLYLLIAAIVAGVMLLLLVAKLITSARKDRFARYQALSPLRSPYLLLTFMGIGLPLVALIPLLLIMRHLRRGRHVCSNCAATMHLVDEVHDNDYLTPAQDVEERINSIDYDVWLCPQCGQTEILPYVQRSSAFTECPACHTRAYHMISDTVVARPTATREGLGTRTYRCEYCRHQGHVNYTIARTPPPVVVVGGSGRGGIGGGGFGGGSFGGGSTGGGGASGSW